MVKYRRTEAAMREEDDSVGDADDPALAFARVEVRLASVHGEVALLRAAIEGLTAASENTEIPDYDPRLGRTEQLLGIGCNNRQACICLAGIERTERGLISHVRTSV